MNNLDKLVIGKEYKYKELCELFGEKVKTSDSKMAQLKEWGRWFRWSNPTKQKYRIEEIYEEPHEKIDGRVNNGGNNTSKYQALDDVIMRYMLREKYCIHTISALLARAGLLSKKYLDNKWEQVDYYESGVSQGVINNVFWKMAIVDNAGKSSLKRLERDGYISVVPRVRLVLKGGSLVLLSREDSQKALEMREELKEELHLAPNALYNREIRKEFDKQYNKKLGEEFSKNIDYSYRMHEITLLNKEYTKRNTDIYALTRKFVKEICVYLINIQYKDFYIQEKTRKQVAYLVSELFNYMSDKNWEQYFADGELSDNEDDLTFLIGYVLFYFEWKKQDKERENRRKVQEEKERTERARNYAISHLGEERVLEMEDVIPDIDWVRLVAAESEEDEYLQCLYHMMLQYDKLDGIWGFNSEEEKEDYIRWKVNDAKRWYLEGLEWEKQRELEKSGIAELFRQIENSDS